MSKQVWVDLEETVINNWNDGFLLTHTHKIRKYLNLHEVSDIRIWSFAIWNDKDKTEFVDSGMKKSLEIALDVNIIEYPSVEEIQKLVFHYENTRYDSRSEFMSMNGKFWSFVKYCMGHQIGNHCVLIDDAVPDWRMSDFKDTFIETINIKNLK